MAQLSRDDDQLAERFEAHRDRLQAVAYRMLGSLAEAEDAARTPGCASTATAPTASRTLAVG